MGKPTRWVTDTSAGHSEWYVERFRTMAAEGADLAGEARLVDAMVRRGARVLDAGCGSGRVGAELAARGHTVVGVDADPVLIEAARSDHPGPRWLVADLAELDLAAEGEPEPFDAAVLAGNVVVFVAPGTEAQVLGRVAAHVARRRVRDRRVPRRPPPGAVRLRRRASPTRASRSSTASPPGTCGRGTTMPTSRSRCSATATPADPAGAPRRRTPRGLVRRRRGSRAGAGGRAPRPPRRRWPGWDR